LVPLINQKQKEMKLLTKLMIFAVAIVTMASCLSTEDMEEVTRTEAQELAELEVYLDTLQNRGLDIDTTALGVYYVVDSAGFGPYPAIGDTCVVKYDGFLMNGMLFDSSSSHNTEGTFEFVMDDSAFIRGWTDGMRVINEGALVYLFIPSEYGYGATGSYTIGPYQTLIFIIEMVDIKQAY